MWIRRCPFSPRDPESYVCQDRFLREPVLAGAGDWVEIPGLRVAALDPGGGSQGSDRSAYAMRLGCYLLELKSRGDLRPDEAAGWARALADEHACHELRYDEIGLRQAVAAAFRQAEDTRLQFEGFNAAGRVVDPDLIVAGERTNGSLFINRKLELVLAIS